MRKLRAGCHASHVSPLYFSSSNTCTAKPYGFKGCSALICVNSRKSSPAITGHASSIQTNTALNTHLDHASCMHIWHPTPCACPVVPPPAAEAHRPRTEASAPAHSGRHCAAHPAWRGAGPSQHAWRPHLHTARTSHIEPGSAAVGCACDNDRHRAADTAALHAHKLVV